MSTINECPTFDADALACALALAGNTPTPDELTAALAEMYPAGNAPTVTRLLAAELLVPAISDRRRLRLPPVPCAELDRRLAKQSNAAPATIAALTGPLFNYYRGPITNKAPHAAITVGQLWAVLTSPRQRAPTEALRAAPVGSPQRASLKKRLDYVTPAGTFTHRQNEALLQRSGLLALDFDHVPDLAAARAALLADELLVPELALLFVSPSGDGLKALVRAELSAPHRDSFRAWADYLAGKYASLGLVPDEAGKDVSRACFVPHDPAAWLAPSYQTAA